MYLNLDLLYNVNDFLFPLFYYIRSSNDIIIKTVYSPITKKIISYQSNLKFCFINIFYIDKINIDIIYKTTPFKISKWDLEFLNFK